MYKKPEIDNRKIASKKASDRAVSIARGSTGYLNPNPLMVSDKLDYEGYFNYDNVSLDTVEVDKGLATLKVVGHGNTLIGTGLLPVDYNKKYRGVIKFKSVYSGSEDSEQLKVTHYMGIACFDSDQRLIYPEHLTKIAKAEVVSDVQPNDTTITFRMLEGSFENRYLENPHRGNRDDYIYRKCIRIYKPDEDGKFRYIGKNGRKYDEWGYSRWILSYCYGENALTDNGDGTITVQLKKPYKDYNVGVPLKAGDIIVNSYRGGIYNYWVSALERKPNKKWHTYKSPWRNPNQFDDTPEKYWGVFRNGTAYVKFIALPNYLLSKQGEDNYWDNNREKIRDVTTYYALLGLEWKNLD
jgi:hypothetical protein